MDWTLGRAARAQWLLREDGTFLNHGSYGACPRPVLEAHAALRLEAGQGAEVLVFDLDGRNPPREG